MEIINSENYVDKAEAVIKALIDKDKKEGNKGKILTTSQIRKQLAMTAELSTSAESEAADELSSDIKERIEYLRVQFLYQAGRYPEVRRFIDEGKIIDILKSVKSNKKDFLTFCRYMEALVAFRKYLYEKDE